MRYRLTCLTPTLVGDGQRLSPIDYMVWRDQVNVLDQNRIFKMLAKGPRLEPYLAEVRKAQRLEWAAWGGYAQSYAARRIPFEHPSLTQLWERSRPDALHIPTFASGPGGVFLPGSALKGALRTGLAFSRWADKGASAVLETAARRVEGDRVPRRLAQQSDSAAPDAKIGDGTRREGDLKVYYLRTARFDNGLSWKDTSPSFVEMASPGTVFEGAWASPRPDELLKAANRWSVALLEAHLTYAKSAGLAPVAAAVEGLRFKLVSAGARACLLSLGWGAGFLGKAAVLETATPSYRSILRAIPLYARAAQTNLPFPKTRRVVHLNGQPATLPGWVLLELTGD